MKLLRKMEEITLQKILYDKQPNGQKIISNYEDIENYRICFLEINDEVSASIYGAEVNSMKRISSVRNELENFLLPKMDSLEDNISKYVISYNEKKYKIKSVKPHYIDVRSL